MGTPQDPLAAIHHHLFDTAFGVCGVAWSMRGLTGVQLPEKDGANTEFRLAAKCHSTGSAEPPQTIATLAVNIQNYLDGERVDFSSVTVDFSNMLEMRRRIYVALRRVPFGRTTTYSELAVLLGMTEWEGARDVGEAMGRNPMPLVIPCHRVLVAGGKLGGFSAYGGGATKQRLLALEGVHFDGGAPRLPGV